VYLLDNIDNSFGEFKPPAIQLDDILEI